MNNQPTRLHYSPVLLKLSICCMIISIVLPGFYTHYETYYGLKILLTGLFFGWLSGPGGLAVYANLFYIRIVYKLIKGKKSHTHPLLFSNIALIFLAGCTAFFTEVNSLGNPKEVVAWGWGAIIWGISIMLLYAAQHVNSSLVIKQHTILWLSVSVLILLNAGILKYNLWQRANNDEKARYLRFGAAFNTKPLSGIPYIPFPEPESIPIHANTLFEIKGELNSNGKLNIYIDENGHIQREQDLPDRFKYGQYIWENKRYGIWFLKPSSQIADYTLHIQPGTHQAEFSLSTPIKTLWKAPAIITEDPYYSSGIYPNHDSALRDLFIDYNNLLLNNRQDSSKQLNHYTSETAGLSCPITHNIKVMNVPDVFKWQNTLMWLERHSESHAKIQQYQSFCSPSYAILLPPANDGYPDYTEEPEQNRTVTLNALLFSRPDMRFIDRVSTTVTVPKLSDGATSTIKYLKVIPQAEKDAETNETIEYRFNIEPIMPEENQ
ncbi:hypothetical protein [Neisseria dumasiana]|nr:hypothetical protein [Neisseria dumasiana]UOO83674.1 hypothetical protein LVJ88_08185 [Neisseria dumasiana]